MSTSALIFNVMGLIGFITFIWDGISVFRDNGIGKKKDWRKWAVGQVLVLPSATMDVVNASTTKNWIVFIGVLATGLVAI